MFAVFAIDYGFKFFVCLCERVIDAIAMIACLKNDQPEVEFEFEEVQ